MTWSDNAWKNIASIFTKITEHPFIIELMNGTLPKEKFEFYMRQDAYYLADFGRVLGGIGTKLKQPEHMEMFLNFATNTVKVEQILHEHYLKDMYTFKTAPMSPTCLSYVGFLHKHFNTGSIEVALAAVLPCFWIYKEVGDYIVARQTKEHNPYQDWINTYSGEDFALSVQQAIAICNTYALETTEEQRVKMTEAFVQASKLEWLFWDSAYLLEPWKI